MRVSCVFHFFTILNAFKNEEPTESIKNTTDVKLDFDIALNLTDFINEINNHTALLNITGIHSSKLIDGRFRIGRMIGHGAFGRVHLGLNMETNEQVAIKFEELETKQLIRELAMYKLLRGGC